MSYDRKKKSYKVFTKELANNLCKRGFRVIGTDINNQKPWLNIFLFDDTEQLRQAVSEEVNKIKQSK